MAIPATPDITAIPTPPRQAVAIFIIFFFTALAFIAFSMRVWTRLRVTRQWGPDDTLMVPAELCSLLLCPPFYMYTKLGYYGWHQKDVPADYDPSPGLWWFYLAQIFYNPILALVKCSVLLFILRVGGLRTGVRRACFGLITFTACQAVAIFCSVLLQCLPIEANWNPAAKADAKCIDKSFHVTISSITILTDILVVALPFYVFLGLNMRRTTKILVLCIFALGGIVTIIGIFRLSGLIQLFYFPEANKDPFYDIKMVLSVIEVNTAIVTACAPALRPLLRHTFPSLFAAAAESSSSSSSFGDDGHHHHHNNKNYDSRTPYSQRSSGNLKTYGGGDLSRCGSGSKHPHHHHHHHHPANKIAMKSLRGHHGPAGHFEVLGSTLSESEEAIMTYDGIMRTMDVKVQYEDTKNASLNRIATRDTTTNNNADSRSAPKEDF